MAAQPSEPIALIMAGGSGTRFWPLSTRSKPKQFLSFFSERSLLQLTSDRILPLVPINRQFVIATENQKPLILEQLPQIGAALTEPSAKNTAACLMLAVTELFSRGFGPETPMIVLPADHLIQDSEAFLSGLIESLQTAKTHEALVTLGIKPTFAHTGYGYIQCTSRGASRASRANAFHEKPDEERARSFVQTGDYYWNAGIFIWTLGAIRQAFEVYCAPAWNGIEAAKTPSTMSSVYNRLPSTPIDKAVLEKAKNVWVVPCEMGWSDVGSFKALYDLAPKDVSGNACLSGEVWSQDSKGCLVQAPKEMKVALLGVDDLIVIQTENTLLIVPKDRDQQVRTIAQALDPA